MGLDCCKIMAFGHRHLVRTLLRRHSQIKCKGFAAEHCSACLRFWARSVHGPCSQRAVDGITHWRLCMHKTSSLKTMSKSAVYDVCSNIQDFQGPLVISIDCFHGNRCQTKDKDSLLHWDCGCLRTKVQEIVGSTLIFSALNNMKQNQRVQTRS